MMSTEPPKYENGHKYIRDERGIQIDAGAHEEKPKPCALRLPNGGWCLLPDKHEGACDGIGRQHGPVESIWAQHRGQKVICGKVTGPATLCHMQRGHGGSCK
jgi:hypothetical protein